MKIKLIRIYRVNKQFVIAHSAEKAIEIFKNSDKYTPSIEINRVELLTDCGYPDFALIEEPEKL